MSALIILARMVIECYLNCKSVSYVCVFIKGKLHLFRSDIAWEDDTKYSQMLDYLLDNFNMVERFEGLDRKFKIGEVSVFFLYVYYIYIYIKTSIYIDTL